MTLAFLPPPPVTLAIAGSHARFPVHRIYCVGRNYADHAAEMGGDAAREPPFFFMKPADAATQAGLFPYPPASADVHHEVELVVALGEGAGIFAYAVGIDMTRRDRQAEAKKMGRPWDVAKGFDHSAPLSVLHPSTEVLRRGAITLDVNGTRRQSGDIAQMIWPVDGIITELGKLYALQPGDLIFTGTPAGVGAVVPGDQLTAAIAGVDTLRLTVA
jgi:fumarylpyruvate hydrolase